METKKLSFIFRLFITNNPVVDVALGSKNFESVLPIFPKRRQGNLAWLTTLVVNLISLLFINTIYWNNT